MLAYSFLIESSSKLLVTRAGIEAWMSVISGLWFSWPIYMFFEMRFDLGTLDSGERSLPFGLPVFSLSFELPHDKTNKMICAPSEDSDQPGHLPSLIRVFAVCMKKAWVLSCPLSAQRILWSDWADAQADLSLRWAHSHFVSFVIRLLIWAAENLSDAISLKSDPISRSIYNTRYTTTMHSPFRI